MQQYPVIAWTLTPQDDPEFWDRPADPPPSHGTLDDFTLYEAHGVIYQGDLAIIAKTKSFYHYTENGWVKGLKPKETDA